MKDLVDDKDKNSKIKDEWHDMSEMEKTALNEEYYKELEIWKLEHDEWQEKYGETKNQKMKYGEMKSSSFGLSENMSPKSSNLFQIGNPFYKHKET